MRLRPSADNFRFLPVVGFAVLTAFAAFFDVDPRGRPRRGWSPASKLRAFCSRAISWSMPANISSTFTYPPLGNASKMRSDIYYEGNCLISQKMRQKISMNNLEWSKK
jgi:hypothetical protein